MSSFALTCSAVLVSLQALLQPAAGLPQSSSSSQYPNCPEPYAVCESNGVDFVNGGSYFQNTLSLDPFSFVEEFEGCQNDVAQNILVDPNGNEYTCTNTDMQPLDTPMQSNCTELKSQMFSGAWSIIILSNNGQCAPIAYQRDFSISAGPQITETYTPTIVFTTTTTPVQNTTVTATVDSTTTAPPPYTTTNPAATSVHTDSVTPAPKTITQVITVHRTLTSSSLKVEPTTITKTASCVFDYWNPYVARRPDMTASHIPSLATVSKVTSSAATATATQNKAEFMASRENALASMMAGLVKRAPDNATVTVTDLNTNDFLTSIITATAPPIINTVTAETTDSFTTTLAPVTVYSGTAVKQSTITLPQATSTVKQTTNLITTTIITVTQHPTLTTTYTPEPEGWYCTAEGGKME